MKKTALLIILALFIFFPSGCKNADTEKAENGPKSEKTAVSLLQKRISESGSLLGVGFFGYVDSEGGAEEISEFIKNSPLAETFPFLTDYTTILTDGAELYAFVPVNGNTSATVYPAEISESGYYIDRKDAPVYIGKPGEIIVLRCNFSEVCSNVLISVSDGETTLEFHPMISLENGRPTQENGCCDFSVYEKDPVEDARERLLSVREVQNAMLKGMKLLYTGDSQSVEGSDCLIFALGTDSEEQFVKERLYAVSGDTIYGYSAVTDSWEALDNE